MRPNGSVFAYCPNHREKLEDPLVPLEWPETTLDGRYVCQLCKHSEGANR